MFCHVALDNVRRSFTAQNHLDRNVSKQVNLPEIGP